MYTISIPDCLLTLVFLIFVGLLFYHYIGYPVLVMGLSALKQQLFPDTVPMISDESLPSISFIIAAYNEEKVLEDKLKNTLALNYPRNKLKVIVVTDGSDDNTTEIANNFSERQVKTLHKAERQGKTAALNRAVATASGEIIVFSDANNDFSPDALKHLVKHFSNPGVGGVCGLKKIRTKKEREASHGDNLYWKYESLIKLSESRLGTITAADGEIFAMRRALFEPQETDLINDDAALTLTLIRNGYQIKYETEARSYEEGSISIEDDFWVKVRMISGGYQTVFRNPGLLLPTSWFSLAFFSHKILRWTSPLYLFTLLPLCLVLAKDPLFLGLLIAQLSFYLLAAWGWSSNSSIRHTLIFYLPYYFTAMNVAALFGLFRYLSGKQTSNWRKAQR